MAMDKVMMRWPASLSKAPSAMPPPSPTTRSPASLMSFRFRLFSRLRSADSTATCALVKGVENGVGFSGLLVFAAAARRSTPSAAARASAAACMSASRFALSASSWALRAASDLALAITASAVFGFDSALRTKAFRFD